MTTMTAMRVHGIPAGIEFDVQNEKLVARIEECLAHALAESFKENLERLAGFARGGGKLRLGLDFADLSFGFAVIRPDGSCWIVGGLNRLGDVPRGGASAGGPSPGEAGTGHDPGGGDRPGSRSVGREQPRLGPSPCSSLHCFPRPISCRPASVSIGTQGGERRPPTVRRSSLATFRGALYLEEIQSRCRFAFTPCGYVPMPALHLSADRLWRPD